VPCFRAVAVLTAALAAAIALAAAPGPPPHAAAATAPPARPGNAVASPAALLRAPASPSAAEPAAPWLSPEWTARRTVEARVQPARHPGSEVAVCTFLHGGLAKPDGSDVRVAVRGRQLVGHRVICMGPGDLCRVAFAAASAETRYYVYYGNPKAPPPDPWQPQRGLLLEVRRWSGPQPDRLEQVQAAWDKAQPIGADFVSHVSFAFNPFGESDRPAIYRFTGWFAPPATGAYTMATTSSGGSWMVIDGQPAVAWPGPHGPLGDARHAALVALTAAPHKLEYWNTSPGNPTTMVAAWQPPQAPRFEVVPARAFLPVVEAALLELDLPGERLVADFFASNAGETWWPDQYAIRMQFRNLSKGASLTGGARFAWDFGDGQTSSAASPAHVYLAAGDYTVTLKCIRLADSSTFRAKVRVDRNWWKQTESGIDPVRRYAEDAAQYDFSTLDLRSLTAAVSLFDREAMSEPLVAAAAALLRRPDLREGDVPRLGLLQAEHLRKADKPDEAVAALRALEARIRPPPAKAQAAAEIGDVLLKDQRRFDEAEKEFQRVLKTYAASGADAILRRAHVGLGDIWRHRGDGVKARAAYAAAAAIKVISLSPSEAAIRVGTLARYVEDYTRQAQWEWAFKFLDDWAWEFPGDKLAGNWSYLKASALLAQGDKAAALAEALDLTGANPQSPYAVRLLMLAADCHVKLGQPDKARLLLQAAVEDYPEDPDQAKARARLMALGGPVGEKK